MSGRAERFEWLLAATGRTPNVDGLGLEATSLPLDPAGVPVSDRRSTQVGVHPVFIAGDALSDRPLLHEAADQVISCAMELGGNAPFIVCKDANLNDALDGAMLAKMRNSGEACTAANRFYVHKDIYGPFTDGMVKRKPSETDRRTVYVGLTPEGREVFARLASEHEAEVPEKLAAAREVDEITLHRCLPRQTWKPCPQPCSGQRMPCAHGAAGCCRGAPKAVHRSRQRRTATGGKAARSGFAQWLQRARYRSRAGPVNAAIR